MKYLREKRLAVVNGNQGVKYGLEASSLRNWEWGRQCH